MKESKNVRKNLLTVLAVLCALALGIAVGALLLPKDGHLPPDRAPEQDPNAVPYEDTTIQGGEGGSVTLRYQATAEIDRESGTVSIAFIDPASSNQGLVIQLLIQGEVLAESGLLPPGTAVYTLALLPGAAGARRLRRQLSRELLRHRERPALRPADGGGDPRHSEMTKGSPAA